MVKDTEPQHIAVIVVAAGSGSRFGGAVAKQFCCLGGRPLLMHAVDAFRHAVPGAQIIIALSPEMMPVWQQLCRRYNYESPQTVAGGATRSISVRNALEAITDNADIILIHDAARPLADSALIDRVIRGAAQHGAVVPAVPVTDSLRRADTDTAVDRSPFRAVQTPQGFDAQLLRQAYRQPLQPRFTDDASVVEAYGAKVTMVEGSPVNIKITWPRDIIVAEALMKATAEEAES